MPYAPVKSSRALTATIFVSKKVSKNTSQITGLILAPRYLGAKISTQDICLVYTRLSAPATASASARASPWSNRSYFIYQEECRSLPKTWEPNGWVGRGRGVVGAHLKGNPFVGRTRGWSGRRNNNKNNKNNNKPGVAVQPPASPAHRDLHTSFRETPHSDNGQWKKQEKHKESDKPWKNKNKHLKHCCLKNEWNCFKNKK